MNVQVTTSKTSAFAEVLDVLVWGIEPPLETLGGSGVCDVCAAKWQCGGVKTALVCRFSRNIAPGARAQHPRNVPAEVV